LKIKNEKRFAKCCMPILTADLKQNAMNVAACS